MLESNILHAEENSSGHFTVWKSLYLTWFSSESSDHWLHKYINCLILTHTTTPSVFVDPALSTLAGDFIERPTLCVTTRREDLTGLLNCSWSSCREGCTSDVFKCTHIYVQFVELIDDNVNFTFPYNATIQELANFTTEIEKTTTESVLSVNIKGCGCEYLVIKCQPASC